MLSTMSGLNPFEFRAWGNTDGMDRNALGNSLNPFEFRAWGNTKPEVIMSPFFIVLIPLNSGLGEIHATKSQVEKIIVLIPLNSGLGEIQPGEDGTRACAVLIPLNSGLGEIPEGAAKDLAKCLS